MESITLEEAKTWYADADPVHDFDHVLRVYRIAERLAIAEGADLDIVRAAALLHDSRGSAPGIAGNSRMEHHITSANFAGSVLAEKGWPDEEIKAVQHCILTHRYRGHEEVPQTIEYNPSTWSIRLGSSQNILCLNDRNFWLRYVQ